MCKFSMALCALALGTSSVFAHGPVMQVTNSGNKIVTRNVIFDEPYNTFPDAPTPATNVYVMPLVGVSDFGGTGWIAKPWIFKPANRPDANGPGLNWSYSWQSTGAGNPVNTNNTFPTGGTVRFQETVLGNLKQFDGSAFTDNTSITGGAQLQLQRGSGASLDTGFSGSISSDHAIIYPVLSNASNQVQAHSQATFYVRGEGFIPSTGNAPKPVADGIYLAEFQLSLLDQGTGSPSLPTIADSDSFFFVLYKGVSTEQAFAAAQGIPGANIQVAIPEPASLGMLSIAALAIGRRVRRA